MIDADVDLHSRILAKVVKFANNRIQRPNLFRVQCQGAWPSGRRLDVNDNDHRAQKSHWQALPNIHFSLTGWGSQANRWPDY